MLIPDNLVYTKDHEWARIEGDIMTVGITEHAQSQLGDVTFVELPKPGDQVVKETSFGVVESVKAVSDLYAPVSGTIAEINEDIIESPEGINVDPYGDAWLIKIKMNSPQDAKHLMSAKDYTAFVKEQA